MTTEYILRKIKNTYKSKNTLHAVLMTHHRASKHIDPKLSCQLMNERSKEIPGKKTYTNYFKLQ